MINNSLRSNISDIDTFISLGLHYGNKITLVKSEMRSFVLGIWHEFSILNINKAISAMEIALNIIFTKIAYGGKALFVFNRKISSEGISSWLANSNQYCIVKPISGVLTNWVTYKATDMRAILYKRKALSIKNRRLVSFYLRKEERAKTLFVGSAILNEAPKVVILFCNKSPSKIVNEANLLNIPVIGIADEYSNINGIDYIIPISNNSRLADLFVCRLLSNVCSSANMVCLKSKIAGTALNNVLEKSLFDCKFRKDYKIYIACLQFKSLFMGKKSIFKNNLNNLNIIRANRLLDLKFVFRSLLKENISYSSSLRRTINKFKFNLLNSKEDEKKIMLNKLIKNLEIIFGLVKKVRVNVNSISMKYGPFNLGNQSLSLFVPKKNYFSNYHDMFYAKGSGTMTAITYDSKL
ncbi:MAG: 30S ribosomal protein S2 [Candidatus Hodgkinia cicadicola]